MTFSLVHLWVVAGIATALFLNFREWGAYNLFWWEHLFLSC